MYLLISSRWLRWKLPNAICTQPYPCRKKDVGVDIDSTICNYLTDYIRRETITPDPPATIQAEIRQQKTMPASNAGPLFPRSRTRPFGPPMRTPIRTYQ